jgi:hypothetical protein
MIPAKVHITISEPVQELTDGLPATLHLHDVHVRPSAHRSDMAWQVACYRCMRRAKKHIQTNADPLTELTCHNLLLLARRKSITCITFCHATPREISINAITRHAVREFAGNYV